MSNEQNLPEIRFDAANLYQEDVFTDRTAGTIRRLVPVLPSGERDVARPVLFSGQTQLLTPGGVLPLGFEIEAAFSQGLPCIKIKRHGLYHVSFQLLFTSAKCTAFPG